jgi:hypothetical protein
LEGGEEERVWVRGVFIGGAGQGEYWGGERAERRDVSWEGGGRRGALGAEAQGLTSVDVERRENGFGGSENRVEGIRGVARVDTLMTRGLAGHYAAGVIQQVSAEGDYGGGKDLR